MSKPAFRIATVTVVIAIIGAILLLAPTVSAQEPGPTPAPTIASTPLTTDDHATTPEPPYSKTPDLLVLLKSVLMGAIVLWAILFFYTAWIQGRYFDTTVKLARAGMASVPSVVGAEPFRDPQGMVPASPSQLKGPRMVAVGIQSPEYTVSRPEGDGEPISATWLVEPPNAALVVPATGSAVNLIAAIGGVFKLIAIASDSSGSATMDVAAIAPQAQPGKVELPVFGRGYGSIAIAVVVLAVVFVLGLSNNLTEAAIAALLGALVGYIFNNREPTPSPTATEPPTRKLG